MNKRLVWNFEICDKDVLCMPNANLEENQTERWEARFFWPGHQIIVLNGLSDAFLDVSRYQIKHRQDIYCLLDDADYNLKIRRNQPMYKPMLIQDTHATAFGKKINLEEEEKNSALLPNTTHLTAAMLLKRIQQEGLRIPVEKEALIYRFSTSPVVKLELAKLHVLNTTWFSVNIESRSKIFVDTIKQHLFGNKPCSDYVHFLKGLQTST